MNAINAHSHLQVTSISDDSPLLSIVSLPLRLTGEQQCMLIAAATQEDERLWSETMVQEERNGMRREDPGWDALSEALLIPWFETMVHIMLDCDCAFAQVVALKWNDVNLEEGSIRFHPRGWLPVNRDWMDEIEMIPRCEERVFFRFREHQATRVWLRLCTAAGLLENPEASREREKAIAMHGQ